MIENESSPQKIAELTWDDLLAVFYDQVDKIRSQLWKMTEQEQQESIDELDRFYGFMARNYPEEFKTLL